MGVCSKRFHANRSCHCTTTSTQVKDSVKGLCMSKWIIRGIHSLQNLASLDALFQQRFHKISLTTNKPLWAPLVVPQKRTFVSTSCLRPHTWYRLCTRQYTSFSTQPQMCSKVPRSIPWSFHSFLQWNSSPNPSTALVAWKSFCAVGRSICLAKWSNSDTMWRSWQPCTRPSF